MKQKMDWREWVSGNNLLVVILAALTSLYLLGVVIWIFFVKMVPPADGWGALENIIIFFINLPLFAVVIAVITLYLLSISTKIKHLAGVGSLIFLVLAVAYTLLVGTDLYLLLMYPIILYGFLCYIILLLDPFKTKHT